METLQELVKQGQQNEVVSCVKEMVGRGINPEAIMKEGLIPAMDEVGDLYQSGQFFIPEMLIAARAMQHGLDVIRSLLVDKGVASSGKVVVGTVRGDLHDIGKNLVVMVLEGAGFEVIDLGADVPPERFVQAVEEEQPVLVGMSALLTTTMTAMKDTVDAMKMADVRDAVKVMIGGAPIRADYANEIGADFYGEDATAARDIARSVVNGRGHQPRKQA